MSNGSSMIHDLSDTRFKVLLIDDGGATGASHDFLPNDFQLFAAVELLPGSYRIVDAQLHSYITQMNCGVSEFHATEIVNPKKSSPWYSVEIHGRIKALKFLATLIEKHCEYIHYLHINSEQWPTMLPEAQRRNPSINFDQKSALWKVFSYKLVYQAIDNGNAIRLVVDSEIQLDAQTIQIQPFEETTGVDGAFIFADSTELAGIQLADFAAYLIYRIFHVRNRINNGKTTQLDIAITDIFNRIQPKLREMLKD